MEKILIKNGRLVDPANNIDEKRDILIEDGKIKEVADCIMQAGRAKEIMRREKLLCLDLLICMYI